MENNLKCKDCKHWEEEYTKVWGKCIRISEQSRKTSYLGSNFLVRNDFFCILWEEKND